MSEGSRETKWNEKNTQEGGDWEWHPLLCSRLHILRPLRQGHGARPPAFEMKWQHQNTPRGVTAGNACQQTAIAKLTPPPPPHEHSHLAERKCKASYNTSKVAFAGSTKERAEKQSPCCRPIERHWQPPQQTNRFIVAAGNWFVNLLCLGHLILSLFYPRADSPALHDQNNSKFSLSSQGWRPVRRVHALIKLLLHHYANIN